MEFHIEYDESFVDADGYVYVEHLHLELNGANEADVIEQFNERYPNTTHFDYVVRKITPTGRMPQDNLNEVSN